MVIRTSNGGGDPKAPITRESPSLVTQAWRAGGVPRVALAVGGAASVAWAVLAATVAFRFLLNTVTSSIISWPLKAFALVVVPVVTFFLVVSVPVNWLMFLLDRLLERRKRG